MKRGKRLTREQKAIVLGNGLDPKEYMYLKMDDSDTMIVVNIISDKVVKINVHRKRKKI